MQSFFFSNVSYLGFDVFQEEDFERKGDSLMIRMKNMCSKMDDLEQSKFDHQLSKAFTNSMFGVFALVSHFFVLFYIVQAFRI